MKYRVKRGFETLLFVGGNPSGGGVLKCLLRDMTQEQMEDWIREAPTVARRYIDGPEPSRKIIVRDNQPGKPPPQKPEKK